MNTPKHTPGPICTCGVITTVIETGIGCYGENEIAQCPLCKAAPAMYEALKAALDYYRGVFTGNTVTDKMMSSKLEQALAQAEGK
jgi:hypothetical protein